MVLLTKLWHTLCITAKEVAHDGAILFDYFGSTLHRLGDDLLA
jgi:hypothetical protein